MAANNFKELEKLNEDQFRDSASDNQIRKNVSHSIRFFRFFGDIFELYIPKVIGVFVNMSGGAPNDDHGGVADHSTDTDTPKYPNNARLK